MRKLPALLTALSLTIFPMTGTAEAPSTPPEYTLRESAEEIIVFAARNMKANIVGYLRPGNQQDIQVLTVTDGWAHISFLTAAGTSYGFVPLSYFDFAPAATPTPLPAQELVYQGGTPAWVVNSEEGYRLNLREQPAITAKSLGKYYTGTPLTLSGNVSNGFVQVLVANTTFGWVDAHYITTDALAFVPETPMVTVANAGGGAALRSGPGTSFDRIGWYPHGTAVTILGVRENGWCHVQVGDLVGFIAETMLSGTFPFAYGTDSDNPTLLSEQAQSDQQLYINTRTSGGQLHLRKSASVSAKSLGLFYTGTPVTVLSYTRDGWAYVRIGQTEGYMDADYLAPNAPTQHGAEYVVRNSRATGLNLRALPSTGGELLDFAPNYVTLTVLGELSDGWCYVEYNGKTGYMLGDYLRKAK